MSNIQEIRDKNLEKIKSKNLKTNLKEENKNKKNVLKNKKETDFSSIFLAKKKEEVDRKIKSLEEKYNDKIDTLKAQEKIISKETTSNEEEILKNSSRVTKYRKKIETINASIYKKIEKVKYNVSIAKITDEEGTNKINEINMDAGLIYERWDKKIVYYSELTSSKKILLKISKLEKEKKKQVAQLEVSLKKTPATNQTSAIIDKINMFKTKRVFNLQISEIIEKTTSHLRRYSMFYILAFVVLVFAVNTSGGNLKTFQFNNIIQNNAFILIIGLGMLLVILAGYIDLSVGSLMGFMGALSVQIYNQTDSMVMTVIFTIGIGASIGFVQGALIGYFKMPAFIVTLGGMLLFQGLILMITKSQTIIPNADIMGDSSYIQAITGSMPDIVIGTQFHIIAFAIILSLGIIASLLMFLGRKKKAKYGIVNDSQISFYAKISFIVIMFAGLAYYFSNSLFGLRYYVVYLLILVVAFIFITQNTSFGRKIYAIGGNKKAAELSGINSARVTVYIFMIVGGLVGFAAIIYTAIISNAGPAVSSAGYELDIISSVFVGGASMSGGIGTIQGTLIGGLILGYINNGMTLMNFQADMQKVIKAIVLLSAVGYDIYSNRKIG